MDIWIINGIPGAGKTATARALAARFEKAAHIEGDRLQEWIVAGGVAPGQLPREEEERQIHLNVRNQCLLARFYAGEGFTPVIDYVVVNRARVEEYRSQLAGFQIHLVTLAPGIEVALNRDRRREEKTVAPAWAHLDEIMRRELAGVGLWIDNSKLGAVEMVECILSRKSQAALRHEER